MSPERLMEKAQLPWEEPPRFDIAMANPLAGSEWTWRELDPHHPAIREQPAFLRRYEADDVRRLISDRHGDPTAYCVMGAHLAAAMGWRGLSFDEQYRAITRGAGAFPCGGMNYLRISGPDAAQTLELLTPRSISHLDVRQAAFAIFTTPEGTVDTEGIVLRDGPNSYLVSIGGDTRPPAWLYDAVDQYRHVQVEETNISSFNIKGPKCVQAMS
jgi:glycine cleavage system aminomethyltransferase T